MSQDKTATWQVWRRDTGERLSVLEGDGGVLITGSPGQDLMSLQTVSKERWGQMIASGEVVRQQ